MAAGIDDATLRVVIKAVDEASAVLKSVQGQVESAGAAVEQANEGAGKSAEDASDHFKSVSLSAADVRDALAASAEETAQQKLSLLEMGQAGLLAASAFGAVGNAARQLVGGPLGDSIAGFAQAGQATVTLVASLRTLPAIQSLVGAGFNLMLGPIGLVAAGVAAVGAAVAFFTTDTAPKATDAVKVLGEAYRTTAAEGARAFHEELNRTLDTYADIQEAQQKARADAVSLTATYTQAIEDEKLKAFPQAVEDVQIALIEKYQLLGPELGRLLNDAGQAIDAADLGTNVEAQVNSVEERLKRLSPAAAKAIFDMAESLRTQLGITADVIQQALDSKTSVTQVVEDAFDTSSHTTQAIVTEEMKILVKTVSGAALPMQSASQQVADALAGPFVSVMQQIQDAAQAFLNTASGNGGGVLGPGGATGGSSGSGSSGGTSGGGFEFGNGSGGLGGNASGEEFFAGGETLVGEAGPERVRLPRGSRIEPSRQGARGSGQTLIIYGNPVFSFPGVTAADDIMRVAELLLR